MTSDQPWWLTMPPAEVAATILPLFSSSTHVGEGSALKAVASWLTTGSYRLPWAIPGTDNHCEHPDDPVSLCRAGVRGHPANGDDIMFSRLERIDVVDADEHAVPGVVVGEAGAVAVRQDCPAQEGVGLA